MEANTIIEAECLDWLKAQPDNSVDLVFTSPPYEDARLYSKLQFQLRGQDWVDWAVERFVECARVSRGLVAWVVEGKTRKYRWSATPALMLADLHRSGIHLRKPPIFHRVGIPGSGGPDWLRNDWEFIVCGTSDGGKLPWSENTAMGHPPKWAPGGEMSYRLTDGTRRNQWGSCPTSGMGGRKQDGQLQKSVKPSHTVTTPSEHARQNGAKGNPGYDPPAVANPGNVIKDRLSLNGLIEVLQDYANATKTDPIEVLRSLRQADEKKAISEWFRGIYTTVLGQEILLASMHGGKESNTSGPSVQKVRKVVPSEEQSNQILQHEVLSRVDGKGPGKPTTSKRRSGNCSKDHSQDTLRGMRSAEPVASSPHGRKSDKQPSGQSTGPLPSVSSKEAPTAQGQMQDLWKASEVLATLRKTLPKVQEAWRSTLDMYGFSALSPLSDCSGLIRCNVGKGHMGSDWAHKNEAPFPESLAEFFVRSFCPPEGIVLDPFVGSGTTPAAAVRHGRRYIGIDARLSQVALSNRRVAEVSYSCSQGGTTSC